MVKFSKIVIFILLINLYIFTNYTATKTVSSVRNNLIKMCEGNYEKNSSNLYYCMLSQFFALERVLDVLNKYKSKKDVAKFDKILRKHLNKKYDVFDFIETEKEFNNYLKEKEYERKDSGR